MSRSYRQPYTKALYSDRWFKKNWHGRIRARVRNAIHHGHEVMPHRHEVSDLWMSSADVNWRVDPNDKWLKFWKYRCK